MTGKKQPLVKQQNLTPPAASARERYSTAIPASTRTTAKPKARPGATGTQKKNDGRKAQAQKIVALEAEIAMLKAKGLPDATTVAGGGEESIAAQERGVWQPSAATEMGKMTLRSRTSAPDRPSVKDFRDQFLNGNIGNRTTGTGQFSAPHVLAKHNPVKEKGTNQSGTFLPPDKSANPKSLNRAPSKKQKKTAKHWWQIPTRAENQPGAVITAGLVQHGEAIPRFNGLNQTHPTRSTVLTIRPKTSAFIPVTAVGAAPWTAGVDQFPARQNLHPSQSEKIHAPLANKTKTSATQQPPPVQHVLANEPAIGHQHGQTFGCTTTTPATPSGLPPSVCGRDQLPQHGQSVLPWRKNNTAMNIGLLAATNAPDVPQYANGTHVSQSRDRGSQAPLKPLPPPARSQDLDGYGGRDNVLQSYNDRMFGPLKVETTRSRTTVIEVRNQPPHQPNSNAGLSVVEQAIQEARQRMGYIRPAPILAVVVPEPVLKDTSVTAKRHFEPTPNRNMGPPVSRKRRKKIDGSGNAQSVPAEFVDLTIDLTEEDYGLMRSEKSRDKLNAGISRRMSDSHGHQSKAHNDMTVPEIHPLQPATGITTAVSTNASLRFKQQEGAMKYWNLEYYPDLREDGRLKYE